MGMRSGNEEEGSSYDVQQRCFGGGWNKYCRFQLRLDHNLFVNPLLTSERQNINQVGGFTLPAFKTYYKNYSNQDTVVLA